MSERAYDLEPHRQDAVEWFKSHGYVPDGESLWVIAWSTRSGYDHTGLEFYPLARHAHDTGWDAIVGCHASGENPRLLIGTCETLADIERTHETLRLINGYKEPEPNRGPELLTGLTANQGNDQ